jgi:hypothetical protein
VGSISLLHVTSLARTWLLCTAVHAGGLYMAASGALKLSYMGLLAFAFIAGERARVAIWGSLIATAVQQQAHIVGCATSWECTV